MRVYRNSYRNRAGVTVLSSKWYVEFRDHRRTVRRIAAYHPSEKIRQLRREGER